MNQQALEKQFISLITECQQIIYKVCYVYTSDEYTLEELYQETVINLWKGFPGFRAESKASTWVYRIAMNTCISYFRQSSSRPQTVPIPFSLEASLTDDDPQNYYLQQLHRLINRLGKLERALILLWLDERSYDEIAEILGISKSNVGTRLNRVKDKLKKMSNL
ncbi:MAG: RNA polymerase sigma factor [Bacteroides sp.]|nr:RNA polymerase sigma factor [Bacteroides sp.]